MTEGNRPRRISQKLVRQLKKSHTEEFEQILQAHPWLGTARDKDGQSIVDIASRWLPSGKIFQAIRFVREQTAVVHGRPLSARLVGKLRKADAREFRRILKDQPWLATAVDGKQRNVLVLAATNGSPAKVRAAMAVVPDINRSGVSGNSPVSAAVAAGNLAAVRELLAAGALPEPDSMGLIAGDQAIPLCDAAAAGNRRMVKMLLDAGADPNVNWEEPPIMPAIKLGYTAIVRLLVERGATLATEDLEYSWTPLHFAVEENDYGMVRYLLEHGGMDENIWSTEYRSPSPLHLAKNARMARILLKAGATEYIEQLTMWESRYSPLQCAAGHGRADVVRVLLEYGADVDTRAQGADNTQETALHSAAGGGWAKCVTLLAEAGATLDAEDDIGATPAEHAASQSFDDIVELLVSYGATPPRKGRRILSSS